MQETTIVVVAVSRNSQNVAHARSAKERTAAMAISGKLRMARWHDCMYVQCKNVTIRVLQTETLYMCIWVSGQLSLVAFQMPGRCLVQWELFFSPLIDSVSCKASPKRSAQSVNSLLGMLLIGRQVQYLYGKWRYATEYSNLPERTLREADTLLERTKLKSRIESPILVIIQPLPHHVTYLAHEYE